MNVIEWLETLRKQGMKLGLGNTRELLSRLDNPQNNFPSIHVAGSNGKGTTCSLIANTFSLNGIKTGFFSSPHLCNVEERIRIDGIQVTELEFSSLIEKLYSVCEIEPRISPTYYEATFIAAMIHFSSKKIERAVIETGLGGRLDATRLVLADCCILTQISLEHTEILGETLLEIALEKSAIAREGIPLISTWIDDEETRKKINQSVSSPELIDWYKPSSNQNFLDEAAGLANLAFRNMNLNMNCDDAVKKTTWPGRMQKIEYSDKVNILLDCAHNPSGMSRATYEISNTFNDIENIIFGCTKQSTLDDFLQSLIYFSKSSKVQRIILTEPQGGRTKSESTAKLLQILSLNLPEVKFYEMPNPFDALENGLSLTKKGTLLCIGSLYLIGNLLELLELDNRDHMKILS